MNLKRVLNFLVTYAILKRKSITLFINTITILSLTILSLIILENSNI